jgi:hypothetical protein
MKILPAMFLLLLSCSARAAVIDPAHIKQIASTLPAHPAGFGEPITSRAAWARLAALPAFQDTLREARGIAGKPLPESTDDLFLDYSKTGNRERWQKVAGLRRGRVPHLALAECLENGGQFMAPLEETIRAICAERTWVMPAHDGRLDNFYNRTVEMDLGATMLAWDLATADYLLADKLSPATCLLVHENLDRRIFGPYRDMVEGRRKEMHWLRATHNWNAVCLAGITGSALATLESREQRAFFVAAAQHYVKNFLRGFTPDGYCSEGLGYWNYGFGYFVMMAEAIRQATGNTVDLLAEPAARGPAFFGLRSEILNGVYPCLADCGPGTKPGPHMMNYLCRRFGMRIPACEPPSSLTHGALSEVAMYNFLPAQWPVLRGAAEVPLESPHRTWFKDGGVLICRPAAQGPEFAVALKGGHNAEHHNHNDVGTFMVVSGRSMVLCDPGAEVYTARTFGAHRYDSDVLNSFGHPVPVIAGQLQRTGIQAKGNILRTEFTDAQDTIVLDISSAYAVPSLQTLERTFTYQRQPTASLTVADRVEFEQAQTFETALLTWGRWQQVSEQDLFIADDAGALRVKIDTGGQAFRISSKRLEADVRTPQHAERLGIALSAPVKSVLVTLTITPAATEIQTK